MSVLNICTFNARGLNDKKKRTDVFAWLKRKRYDIYFLQETHSTESIEKQWEDEWGYKAFFSSHTGNSRGVAILFNNTFPFTVINTYTDTQGRFIFLDILINDLKYTILILYGPNDDDPNFFQLLQLKLEQINNEQIIIGGDFNVVQDYLKDTLNIRNRNNLKSNEKIKNMKNDLDLYDPWINFNEFSRSLYTWHNSRNQHSRIDYFLVSSNLMDQITAVTIKPGYRSDHSLVTIKLKLSNHTKGPGLWKFNNSLLYDQIYVEEIKQCINDTLRRYKEPNCVGEDAKNWDFRINDKLLFETLKLEIRGKTIAYASAVKKQRAKEEKDLELNVTRMHDNHIDNPTLQNLQDLENAQKDLKTHREQNINGIIMRSKAKWNLLGERCSKYFCNLEKKHYTQKLIPNLIDNDGNELDKLPDILKEQSIFYEKLYSSKNPRMDEQSKHIFFPEDKRVQSLSVDEKSNLEHEITIEESYEVLKNMKKDKSPGSDGFTVEFYTHFWDDLKTFIVRSFKDSFENNLLSNSQRLGVITCLPKPGKPKEYLKNWRPITLLNVDYKILSTVISNRLKLYLDKLISSSQKGFVRGRQIGECTRLVSDIITDLKNKNKSGILLLIDFEKAFDSIEWCFIDKTLSYFNFGINIRKWVKLLYTQIESFIINNGHSGNRFTLGRGVRQGDPLSPYLFILATEIMASGIKNHEDIEGIMIDNSEFLISQLADDTTLFLKPSKRSFITCMKLLDIFASISGLTINYSKTLAVKIGLDRNLEFQLEGKPDIQWQSEGRFTLLGIKYDLDQNNFTEGNYTNKIDEFSKCLNLWNYRQLTLYGKICIIKSIALPKLVHLFSALPNPSENDFKKLEQICFNFIWKNGSEKIKRTTLCNSYENGGLKIPNIRLFCMAQKLVWVKKLLDDRIISEWKTLFLSNTEKYGGNYIWLSSSLLPGILNKINTFWADVYISWNRITNYNADLEIECQNIFHNNDIKVGKKTIFYPDWVMNGIRYINDIIQDDGSFYTFEQFERKFGLTNQYFRYYSLLHCIPREWKTKLKEKGKICAEVKHARIIKLRNVKRPANYFYIESLEHVATRPTKSENKWEIILNQNIHIDEWKDIYTNTFKITQDTKQRILQYKIIHRIIPLNDWLFKCNLSNTKNCCFCSINTETIEHFFYECTIIKNIWFKLADLLNTTPFTLRDILLGDPNIESSVRHIILIAKEHIYQSKLNLSDPNFNQIINAIKRTITIENQYQLYSRNIGNKWDNIINLI